MAENVYLKGLREKYEALRKSIEGLQLRASEARRDLTSEELRAVIEQGEQAKSLYSQIQDLSEIELRNAKVAAMADQVNSAIAGSSGPPVDGGLSAPPSGGMGDQTRSVRVGGAQTQDRDPGLYIRGGEHSFMGDQYRAAKMNDTAAADRLLKHSNALRDNVQLRAVLGAGATTFGAGLVPPVWLAEDFAPILHKRLRLATVLRQVPWAGPFAWSIPVANTVAKTGTTSEGVNTTITDPSYNIITVTPTAIMGYAEVSRQMLESSNPGVDAVIWGDLMGDFYDNCEIQVITAVNGQSGTNSVTVSAGAATTSDILAQRSGLLDGIAAICDAPAGDATHFVGRTSRWTTYLKLQDGQGRPIILAQSYNPQNAIGLGSVVNGFRQPVQGVLESLEVITSPSVAASTGFIVNAQEHLFSISPPMQFQFEQPVGPALIRIGVWGYEAVTFARRPKAVTKITYSGS